MLIPIENTKARRRSVLREFILQEQIERERSRFVRMVQLMRGLTEGEMTYVEMVEWMLGADPSIHQVEKL